MLRIHKILPVGFAANCYLVTQDGKNAVAIDPAQERIVAEAEKRGLTIKAVLLTHGHYDHVGGCFALSGAGVPIYCAKAEEELVHGVDSLYVKHGAPMPDFKTEATLTDGQTINLCGIQINVIATPGHTAGGLTFQIENNLFTGDTLFRGTVGRTDFHTSDADAMVRSVKKLYALPGDYTVYAGHGEDSRLSFERRYNYFVRE